MLHLFCYKTFRIGVWECFNRQETIIPEAKNHQNVFFIFKCLKILLSHVFIEVKPSLNLQVILALQKFIFLKMENQKNADDFCFSQNENNKK